MTAIYRISLNLSNFEPSFITKLLNKKLITSFRLLNETMTPPEQVVEVTTEKRAELIKLLDGELGRPKIISQIYGYEWIEGKRPTVRTPKKLSGEKQEQKFQELKEKFHVEFSGEVTVTKKLPKS